MWRGRRGLTAHDGPTGSVRAGTPQPVTDYESKLRDVYSLPSDVDILRKYILDLTMDVTEFRERSKVAVQGGRSPGHRSPY